MPCRRPSTAGPVVVGPPACLPGLCQVRTGKEVVWCREKDCVSTAVTALLLVCPREDCCLSSGRGISRTGCALLRSAECVDHGLLPLRGWNFSTRLGFPE